MNFFTKTQKTLIILTVSATAFFVLVVVFVYLPAKREVRRMKETLLHLETQIGQIEKVTDKAYRLDAGIEALQQKLVSLREKFPGKEEQSIKMISDLARRLNISVTSITPRSKMVYLNEKETNMNGKKVYTISVTMLMRCNYKKILDYLEHLRKNSSSAITAEKLIIRNDRNDTENLSVELELNVYLLT